MKRLKQVVLILLFLAVGVAALLYLNAFTQSGENFRYLDWASARVVSVDGGETFFDPLADPPPRSGGRRVLPLHRHPAGTRGGVPGF